MNERNNPDVTAIVRLHSDWKGELLTQLRQIILSADDSVYEEVKWRMKSRPEGLAVWSSNGIVCRLEIFKNDAKLVFSKGALLADTEHQFNARLDSATERAIEFREGYAINKPALEKLVQTACILNAEKKK
ncbi:MAG TPA: DUF1801 domain-containing protein [Candidatus Saccharibacteria bacterium]|nr:DUF1801 domain-containing protein [Candidatus Saccharibacteria bacterium]